MIPRADERPRCILLKGDGMYEEGRCLAGATILPGYLIELLDDESDVPRLPAVCQPHSTAVRGVVRIAVEDRLGNEAGNLMGKTIDTPYEEDDIVFYIVPRPGDVFQVRVAPQSTWTIGQLLVSGGDGTAVEGTGAGVILEAEENIDFSEVAGDDEPLLRVRVA